MGSSATVEFVRLLNNQAVQLMRAAQDDWQETADRFDRGEEPLPHNDTEVGKLGKELRPVENDGAFFKAHEAAVRECAGLGQLGAFQAVFAQAKRSYWRAWELARQAFSMSDRLNWATPEFSALTHDIGEIEDLLSALDTGTMMNRADVSKAGGQASDGTLLARSFQLLRNEFAKRANDEIRCCLVECPEMGKSPVEPPPVGWISNEDVFTWGQLGTPYRNFKYDLDRPPPRIIDHGARRKLFFSGPPDVRVDFLSLAAEAGKFVSTLPRTTLPSHIVNESLAEKSDTWKWCFLLFDLAWANIEASPLRATEKRAWKNDQSLPLAKLSELKIWNGYEWGREIAERAASFPDPPSWFSVIGDVWRASIYVIDILMATAAKSQQSEEPSDSEATKPDVFDWVSEKTALDIALHGVELVEQLADQSADDAMAFSRTLAELIAQFLHEADRYLAYWNLFQMSLSQAKPTQRPWQGGTLVTQPSKHQLERIERLEGEYLDWGVKVAATGQRLAECLIANGFDPEGVLKIVHRARGGGGGAARVVEIWESVKVKLQTIAIQGTAMEQSADQSDLVSGATALNGVSGGEGALPPAIAAIPDLTLRQRATEAWFATKNLIGYIMPWRQWVHRLKDTGDADPGEALLRNEAVWLAAETLCRLGINSSSFTGKTCDEITCRFPATPSSNLARPAIDLGNGSVVPAVKSWQESYDLAGADQRLLGLWGFEGELHEIRLRLENAPSTAFVDPLAVGEEPLPSVEDHAPAPANEPASTAIPAEDTGLEKPVTKPQWNRGKKELLFNSVLIKAFRHTASNQFLVLDSFEESGWPITIDDPLPRGNPKAGKEVDPVERVQETAKSLNSGMRNDSPIRFSTNGSGTGFSWSSGENSGDAPRPSPASTPSLPAND